MNEAILASESVLCVDLDGTFSRTDTLTEALLLLLKQKPWSLLLLPFWLLGGRAHCKAEIARRIDFDPAALSYNEELLAWLRAEQEAGRKIVLASGADRRIVDAIAAHHGFFGAVVASDGRNNMTGAAKARVLKERFGRYDYVGNAQVDMPVWAGADAALLAAGPSDIEQVLSKRVAFARVFRPEGERPSRLKLWVKALRLHQWVKNTLLFVPLVLSHQIFDQTKLTAAGLGFIAFSLCASSVYLLNDLLDLGADRKHPSKRLRPFAAATLPLEQGLVAIPVLLVAGFALAIRVDPFFAAVLAVYYLVTLAYSLDLKRRALLDVFTLASLYTLRIIAGAVVVHVALSPWLLGVSIFLFLSLGVVKRVAEIESGRQRGVTLLHGRGYQTDDLVILQMLGVASGYASVVVLALYVSAPEAQALYPHHQLLWLFAPLMLYWISRVWLLTHRGLMHDDPIVFALRDPVSRAIGAIAAVIIALAAVG
ncbi:UbiA family prenyltransferase [Parvibaculum sp.]|uniref:UbiA family prenyltransferase n=1 Tax=Parvibaculum sp. TaxID=2024848 RepID=UPI002B583610|nr:UbiA family prenyltransferase [Parvibaculum sp.]HUD51421.1 UbiA family prenyltransferase [Parvibaculum sp.]